jgi:ssDNA-binding Zn-finger/Zn-ribbon topoisomerase 1
MAQRYKLTARCGCGKEFKKVTTNRKYVDLPDGSEELVLLMAKLRCPSCKQSDSERRFRVGDGAVDSDIVIETPGSIDVENYDCNTCHKASRFYKEKEGDQMGHCPRCGSQDVKYIGRAMAGITSQSSQTMIKALDMTAKMTMDTYGMSDINLNSSMRPGDSCAPKLPPQQQQRVNDFFNGGGIPNSGRIAQNAMAGAYRDPGNPVANLHRSKAAPKFDLVNAPPVNVKQGAKISAYDKMLRPN